MEVKLKLNDNWFQASNAKGATLKLGAGLEDGVSPMEAQLMAAGGCTGLDLAAILAKMRQPLKDLEVLVTGRRQEEHPRFFHGVHLSYRLIGDIEEDKARRAIELSLEKYCSVTNGLKADITYEYVIERGDLRP